MGPAWVCVGAVTGSPQAPQADSPPPCWELWPPAQSGPHPITPSPGPVSIPTGSGTHPETHKDSLACGPSPSPSDACTLHPRCTFSHHQARTHIPSLTHTHSWSHTLSKGEATRGTHTGTACPGCSQSPQRGAHPGSQVDQERRAAPLVDLHRTELFAGSLRCSSRRLRGPRALRALAKSLACPRLLEKVRGRPQGPSRIRDSSARPWAALVNATFNGRLCFPASRATSEGGGGIVVRVSFPLGEEIK